MATSKTRKPATASVPNPRASANQASALRPNTPISTKQVYTQTAQGEARTGTLQTTSDQRINPRRAEQQVSAQNTIHAQSQHGQEGTARREINDARIKEIEDQLRHAASMAQNGGTPLSDEVRKGLENQINLLKGGVSIGEGYAQSNGTNFNSLEEAEAKAREEYTKTGTVSPQTSAAIERLRDPSLQPQSSGRTGDDVRADLERQASGDTQRFGVAGASGQPGATGSRVRQLQQALNQLELEPDLTGVKDPYEKRDIEVRNAQKRAALAAELEIEQRKEQEQKDRSKEASDQFTGGTPTGTPNALGSVKTANLLQSFPESIRGLYEEAFSTLGQGDARAQEEFLGGLGGLEEDRATSEAIFQQGMEAQRVSLERELELTKLSDKYRKDFAEEQQRQALAENASAEQLFKVEAARAEQLVREQGIDQEMENRRVAARMGINYDGQGLHWMQDQVRKNNDTLAYLIDKAALGSKDFADQRISLINDYSLEMRRIDVETAGLYSQAYSDYRTQVSSLTKERLLDEKDIRDGRKELRQNYYDRLDALDKEKAGLYKDAAHQALTLAAEADKAEKSKMVSTKDKLGFVSNLRAGIQQNKIISLANDVDGFYGAFNAGYEEYKFLLEEIDAGRLKEGDISLNPSQSGAIGSLSRMFDPGSVVRNEEYERHVLGQSAPAIIQGWFQKLKAGGTGLTPQDLDAMKRVADGLHQKWEEKLSENMQPFILDIDDWNENYPESQIKYDQVISNISRVHLPKQRMEEWESQANDETVSTGSAGWLSPDRAPAGGWRTDRHNNPTAFTVDIAKQAGLVEGVDYESDPSIQNGFPTAKLLGDPIETTIRVIDALGFYTAKGKPRWTHTTMSKKEWDAKSNDQKASTVVAMYQKEGGTGILAQGIEAQETKSTKTYSLVETAEAASPDDVITITEEDDEPTVGTGSMPIIRSMSSPVMTAMKEVPSKRYKNNETGVILTVKAGSDDPYASRPYMFTPVP